MPKPMPVDTAIRWTHQRVGECVANRAHFPPDVLAMMTLLAEIKRLTRPPPMTRTTLDNAPRPRGARSSPRTTRAA